ncbi:hypothetical protein HDV02_006629 [Globomyces sp. JEL0801]|nr:hypothetical protein HDV02_006629 [Globomyces sp. JEL0801]
MDLLHESREGNRGGLGLFNWEDVKADKDREHYLGHSIKASTGRWQKNKNLNWFNEDKKDNGNVDLDEIAEIKRLEAEAMAEALGATVMKQPEGGVSNDEVKELIKKDLLANQDRVIGIGFLGSKVKKSYRSSNYTSDSATEHQKRSKKEKKEKKEKKSKKSKSKSRGYSPERIESDDEPQKRQRDRSVSPRRNHRDRSISPKRSHRDRSVSPRKSYRDRSPSPKRSYRDRSVSPKRSHRDRSVSPKRSHRDRSVSPKRSRRDRSVSPRRSHRDRSPEERNRSRSPRRSKSRR